ncbi:MAG: serine hydrolase, partial [Arenibacter sp.]
MKTIFYVRIAVLFILALLFFNTGQAQMESSSELYHTVLELDSILFEDGFNNCKLKEMEHLIAPDLEFYHDQSGISTSKEEFFKAIEQNICGSGDKKPIRKLVAESMEVFALYNNGVLYGAIQNGVHEFYIKEAHKELYITGI